MRKLLFILLVAVPFLGATPPPVPDTEDFDLVAVTTEIGGGLTSLQACFDNANAGGFDPTYNNDGYAPANSLLRFRNYSHIIDISDFSYTTNSFDISSQDVNAGGMTFNNDGLKLFIGGDENNKVYQYNLTTAYDITSMSYSDTSIFITSQTDLNGVAFDLDGDYMFLVNGDGNSILEYVLTGGDYKIATAAFTGDSLILSSQTNDPVGISFNDDGTTLIVTGQTEQKVFQYTLSTAFDLSTASYANKSLDVSGQSSTFPREAKFVDDGKTVILTDNGNIFQYSLSTAYDISTGSYANKTISVTTQEPLTTFIEFNDIENKFLIIGISNNTIFEYDK